MFDMTNPRETGRQAIQDSLDSATWERNKAFSDELVEMIQNHRLNSHAVAEYLETKQLNPRVTLDLERSSRE